MQDGGYKWVYIPELDLHQSSHLQDSDRDIPWALTLTVCNLNLPCWQAFYSPHKPNFWL